MDKNNWLCLLGHLLNMTAGDAASRSISCRRFIPTFGVSGVVLGLPMTEVSTGDQTVARVEGLTYRCDTRALSF